MKPRKPTTPEAHVAMSMKQASSLWGISAGTLKVAKAAGCPAFVQSKWSKAMEDEVLYGTDQS